MLNKEQYADSSKYEARLNLVRKFKTNPQSKFVWIFSFFPGKENLKVLELGCGTGLFWLANRRNIRGSWDITLSDYSEGMLGKTKETLSPLPFRFNYEIINAEDINAADDSFDVVLANNMLYHIENRDKAIQHIHRILRKDGVFIASTFGKDNLRDLHNYLYRFLEMKNERFRFKEYAFSLNNGREQLAKCFDRVETRYYGNELVIDEADAIIDYYLSFNAIQDNVIALPEKYADEFRDYLRTVLEKEQTIKAKCKEGIFVCRR